MATHLVMQQSMKEIEKLITSRTKAIETSYEAQLQQQRTELAALQAKMVHKDTQLKEYETTLKSAEAKYAGEMDAMSLNLANMKQKQEELLASCEEAKQDGLWLIEENQALEAQASRNQ